MVCPNKNLSEWKFLEEAVGPFNAYKVFIANGYQVPEGQKLMQFLDAINPLFGSSYNQLTSDEEMSYNKQMEDYKEKTGKKISPQMKAAVDKLLYLQKLVASRDNKYVNTQTGEVYNRATEVVESTDEGYYSFDGKKEDYEDNREWGTQTDKILSSVILGKSLEETIADLKDYTKKQGKDILLSDEAINKAYDIFTNFKNQYPDSIILTQMIFFNEEVKIAGTADIVIVAPDGTLKIFDLKSSLYPTNYNPDTRKFEEYQKGEFTNKYDRQFVKAGVKKASKKERHTAQLSLYKGMALSKGFVFATDQELGILPMHILSTENSKIQEMEAEPMFFLDASQEFLEKVYKDETFTTEVDVSKYSKYDQILERVRKTLEERLAFLQRRYPNRYEKYLITQLKENLNTIEKAKAITRFIEDAYTIFIGSKKYPGAATQLKQYIDDVRAGKEKDPAEIITKLASYRDTVDMFRPLIEELQGFYSIEIGVGTKYAEGSPIDKINQIVQSFNTVDRLYKNNINSLVAEQLVKVNSPKANLAHVKEIEQQKQKLKILTPGTSAYKSIEDRIKKLEEIIGPDGVTYDTLVSALDNGSNADIPFIDYLLSPAISSSNPIVALFAKTLKTAFENARQKSRVVGINATKAFNQYKNSAGESRDIPNKFNEPFFEKISVWNGSEMVDKMSFVQDYNADAYNKALSEMYKQASTITDQKNKEQFINKWFAENSEILPEEDIFVVNPETGEKVVIEKGRNTIRKEKLELVDKGVISQQQYEYWVKNNEIVVNGVTYYSRDYRRPSRTKYPNAKYKAIQSNPAKKRYYDFLISTYFKSQERIPPSNKMGYILPSISKSSFDRLTENGIINYAKYKWQDIYKVTEKDIQSYGEVVEGLKVIPVLYTNNMPADDVSVDLISSVLVFDQASLRYEAAVNSSSLGDAALQSVKENPALKTDALGRRVISEAAKKAGIQGWDKYVKVHNGNNIAALLEAFIDMQVYGIQSFEATTSIGGKTIELNKFANALMGFSAFTQIGGNPILSVSNSLQANVQVSIEAIAGEYFNMGEFAWAKGIYDYHIPDYVKDFTEPTSKSFIGQLIDLYDPMQGEFKDKYGRRITQSMWKKLWSTDTWFFLQQQGEHAIQVQTMLAMLKRVKVKQTIDGQTKEVSLYSAYELGSDGVIKLKPGIKLDGLVSDNGLVSLDTQNTLHALNKRMHGVYNSFDKVAIERYWWGKLLLMYRKFLVPGLKKRWKGYGIDQELGNVTEGYWNTFIRLASKQTKEMLKELSPFGSSNLTDLEKMNLRKSATEMGIMLSSGIIILILKSLYESTDDDDEKKLLAYPLVFTMRLNSDLSAFLVPGDPRSLLLPNFKGLYRSFRYPSAAQSSIEKALKLSTQLTNPLETYERKSGPYEKGDLKIVAKILKLAGLNKNTFYPEEILKMLELQSGG